MLQATDFVPWVGFSTVPKWHRTAIRFDILSIFKLICFLICCFKIIFWRFFASDGAIFFKKTVFVFLRDSWCFQNAILPILLINLHIQTQNLPKLQVWFLPIRSQYKIICFLAGTGVKEPIRLVSATEAWWTRTFRKVCKRYPHRFRNSCFSLTTNWFNPFGI